MKQVLSGTQMKAADRYTIEVCKMREASLIEQAAMEVCLQALSMTKPRDVIVVSCGRGNNGADGYAAARMLKQRERDVRICEVFPEAENSPEAALQKEICRKLFVPFETEPDIKHAALVIDAIYGIGCSRKVNDKAAAAIDLMNSFVTPVLSVDMPSGICADTGRVMGAAVRASVTVTFSFYKLGQMLFPGKEYCGNLLLKNAGIVLPLRAESMADPNASDSFGKPEGVYVLEDSDMPAMLPKRYKRSHKGTYGRALLFAGSVSMPGALALAAESTYRTGCGLTEVCTSSKNLPVIAGRLPEAVFTPEEAVLTDPSLLDDVLKRASAVLMGPGWGRRKEALSLADQVIRKFSGCIVLDADALNLMAERGSLPKERAGLLIVTPHLKEMSRLTGKAVADIQDHLIETAVEYAEKEDVICVLKDASSVITDGKSVVINRTGNSGMSTGGSGDVLSGMITGLLAQKMEPLDACAAAVYLHGRAGDICAGRMGERGMLSGDLVHCIPEVFNGFQTE